MYHIIATYQERHYDVECDTLQEALDIFAIFECQGVDARIEKKS